ncbi:MAG: hypothetical protein HYV60_13075, partial [Planctomycetia bacterium]|nr:hypothetical protein [Planctomycetia bacterium]
GGANSGNDTIVIEGSAGNDAFGTAGTPVTDTLITITGREAVNLAATREAIPLEGADGNDSFFITPSATVPFFVLGGDPISATPGDAVNVTLAAAQSVTFNPGPEADAGSFTFGGVAAQPISFDQIESGTITGTGAAGGNTVNVNGTNADNDITVTGTAANSFTASVDGSPAFQYNAMQNLTIDGLAGDDDIDVDVQVAAWGITALNIRGNSPSADVDTVTVTGVPLMADNPIWNSNIALTDAGTLTVAAQAMDIRGVERLIYDGEEENDILTVNGAAASTRWVHTPNGAADAGTISITDIGNQDAGLGIEYVHLGLGGSVRFVSGGAADVLVALGTDSNDTVTVADVAAPDDGAIDLVSVFGDHVDLATLNVEQLIID